jgi:hypothetical protein
VASAPLDSAGGRLARVSALPVSGAATFAWAADRPTRVPVAVVRLDAAFPAGAFADRVFLAADFLATTFFAVSFFATVFFAEGRLAFFATGVLALADAMLQAFVRKQLGT